MTTVRYRVASQTRRSSTASHATSDFYKMAAAPPRRRPKQWQAPPSLQYDHLTRAGAAELDWTPAGRNWLANCLNTAFVEIVVRLPPHAHCRH